MSRQQYIRLLLELLVIFLSVILAFFFEDFRESRNERIQYTTDLLTLRDELVGEIDNINVKLDTFKTSNDLPYRGAKLKRLVNLIWFDSLLSKQKASMTDFRFLIKSNYLLPDIGRYNKIELASEIRLKYTEYFKTKDLIKLLTIYDEEIDNLSIANQETVDSYKELFIHLKKMNPYHNFSKQDSLLLYTNEFIWTYKNCVDSYYSEFMYSRWLVKNRLIIVVNAIDQELERLGVKKMKSMKTCLGLNFYDRFQCENNRQIETSDSIVRVDDLTRKSRTRYLQTNQK